MNFLARQRKRDLENLEKRQIELQCMICEDEIATENSVSCKSKHIFCRNCVKKACEHAVGEGRTSVRCMEKCDETLDLRTLSQFVSTKIVSPIAQTAQSETVKEVS